MKKVNTEFNQLDLFSAEEMQKIEEQTKKIYEPQLKAYIQNMKQEEDAEDIPAYDDTPCKTLGVMQSDLFDVEAVIQANEKKQKEEHQKKVIEARKQIKNLKFYENPKNENEQLFNLQYEYFVNEDIEAWGKLIILGTQVCKHLIWKAMKEQGLQYDEVEQAEKADIAMEYGLRRFQNTIGYCCTTNFIRFFADCVAHATKYRTKEDENFYIADFVEESKFKKIKRD